MFDLDTTLTFGDVLAGCDVRRPRFAMFRPDALGLELRSLPFSQSGAFCDIYGPFDDGSCRLMVPKSGVEQFGRVAIRNLIEEIPARDVTVVLLKVDQSVSINVFNGFSRVIIGRLGYALTSSFWLWPDSTVCIGDEVTSNGFRAILGQSDLIIGRDSMISDEVVFQTIDQHGIVDLDTMKITNQGRRHMTIGEHVWIGRRTMIMRDVSLGSGSVVAAGAVVTKDVARKTIVAGVPARVIKRNASWSRNLQEITPAEAMFFHEPDGA
jgi:acetyltransferase-like isoleucine patch superfamily enzyme